MSSTTHTLKDAVSAGRAFRDEGKPELAEKVFRQITSQLPDHPSGWLGLGQVLIDQLRADEAIGAFEQAMRAKGPTANLHHALGAAKSFLGRLEEAQEHYQEAIRLDPNNPEFYQNYSRLKRFVRADGFHHRIESLLQGGSPTSAERCQLHFAAGKVYDDIGEYGLAFSHFEMANEAKAAEFDGQRWDELIDRSIDVFSSSALRHLRTQPGDGPQHVFVVGMPRSGTTLVEQILSAHPDIYGAGELPDLNVISGELTKHAGGATPFPECVTLVEDRIFKGLGAHYATRLSRLSDATTIVDKTPNNFFFIGLMHALFPNVRVIHCRRHPLDTLMSCYMTHFKVGQEFSYDLDNLAHYYAGYRRLMDHWMESASIPICEIDYESLVENQEHESKRLIDFVQLPWRPECLDFQTVDRVVATASSWQVRQPLYSSSIGRWRNYAEQLEPLRDALFRRKLLAREELSVGGTA